MTNITFIRHAESEYNVKGLVAGRIDCNLSKKGYEDAVNLGNSWQNNFDVIFCSPLKRTKQTLNAIFPNCNPIYDDRIIEVTFGIYEGKPKGALGKEKMELYKKGEYLAPGAESIKQVDKRVCEFVEELFEKYHNENILVVTHSGILTSVKRNFWENYDNNTKNKNLELLTITDDDYKFYKSKFMKTTI